MHTFPIKGLQSLRIIIEDELEKEKNRMVELCDIVFINVTIDSKLEFQAKLDDPVLEEKDKAVVTGYIKISDRGIYGDINITDELKKKIEEGKFWYKST